MESALKHLIEKEIEYSNGILRLEPAWIARNFIPPGKRLGLPEDQYHLGNRGGICERWIGSTTSADNKFGVPNEGLSFIKTETNNKKMTLKEAVEAYPDIIMGKKYANSHTGLNRLAKIFDYEDRLPYHIHQMQRHASLVGRNSKDEAYYFPEGVNPGKHAETFFGVHPHIAEGDHEVLLPHLIEWKDDKILKHSFGFTQYADDGFHVPSGTLHAPGTALTIELQEDSDVFAMMQARVGDTFISKELLWKDVRKEDRVKFGERIILEMINWETSGDPEFYKHRHTPPLEIMETKIESGEEYWIFYNTNKFSGKKLVVQPGGRFTCKDNGVYNILVWQGMGKFGGLEVAARSTFSGKYDLDELLVCHERAVTGVDIVNDGKENLVIYKFFGPDVNPDLPMLSQNK